MIAKPNARTAWAKEKNSLLRMIVAMAVDAYRYNPKDLRSEVTKQIVDASHRLGIRLDDGTVLAWLRQAAELVDQDKIENFAHGPRRRG